MAARSKASKPTPPEKGSFPLDHLAECKPVMQEYMKCLKASSSQSFQCRALMKDYLSCRMDKALMQKEDLSQFGFKKEEEEESVRSRRSKNAEDKMVGVPKAREAYQAGTVAAYHRGISRKLFKDDPQGSS